MLYGLLTCLTQHQDLEAIRVGRIASRSQVKAAAALPTTPSHQTEASALIANLQRGTMAAWLVNMTSFYNRYYMGPYAALSAKWMYSTVQKVASANSAITVDQFAHLYNQPSVIATIPGNSTDVVIVAAHYDSAGRQPWEAAPGAVDNASVRFQCLLGRPLDSQLANTVW